MRHMPEYKDQLNLVKWHIPSEHSTEMATQSNVVCLSVCIFKNGDFDL